MKKIILYMAASIDGFIAKSKGGIDWIDTKVDLGIYSFDSFLQRIDTLIMGRISYEQLLSFGNWPYTNYKTFVFSNFILKPQTPNTKVVKSLSVDFIKELQNQKDKDIWLFGGGNLNHFFLEHDLIDEIMLFIQPVVLGNGMGIFGNKSVELKHYRKKKSADLGGGFTLLWYQK